MKSTMQRSILGICLFICTPHYAFANDNTIHLAVATTIKAPIESICQKFSQITTYKCKIFSAATGHLYAHVMHGMHYDLFISADKTYTAGLVNAQKVEPQSLFVVATGRVVLWSASQDATAVSLQDALINQPKSAIIIANPGASSYGAAAKEALQAYDLWPQIQGRLIYAKNITHSYDLIMRKQVPMGFVSLAQLSAKTRAFKGYWEPEANSYKPVLHEVVTLKPVQHEQAIKEFIAFMRSANSCEIFQDAGFNCASKNHV